MVLMVSLSSRISPFTSTVILRDKSPRATAVATSAMFRTCEVRLPAMKFTLSVRSFHVPATPLTCAWPPSFPSVPTSRATRVTSDANDESWSTIVLIVFFSSRISPFTSTVILPERPPRPTAVAPPVRLPAASLCGPPFSRHPRDLRRERRELVHHRVDRVLQLEDLAFHVHRDLARAASPAHGRRPAGAPACRVAVRSPLLAPPA